MAPNSEPAAGLTPDEVARKTFSTGRKGFDPIEVQGFLLSVATELRESRAQVLELERELRAALADAERNRDVDPARLTAMLGEETVRVLDAARLASDELRARAEQASTQLLEEASSEAARMRREAAEVLERKSAEAEAEVDLIRARGDELRAQAQADAAAETEKGRQQGREMVAEAQRVRERMLNDLARRRKLFRQQIDRLQAGRDRLMSAYDVVRETLDVATEELQVALPEARLAAEAAALRAADEEQPTAEQLEQEAAELTATPEAAPAPASATVADDEPDTSAGEPEADDTSVTAESKSDDDGVLRAPSDATVEGRRSSSVNVIRGATGDAEPEATTDETERPPPPAVSHTAPPPPPAAAEADQPAEVSSLFARIREETEVIEAVDPETGAEIEIVVDEVDIEIVEEIVVDEAEVAELAKRALQAKAAAEAPPADTPASPAAPADPDHALLARRDEALAEIERGLSRRIKRELSDEQNELLDTVRRQKGKPNAEAALPDLEAHLARYRDAARPSLVAAVTAGAELVADSGPAAGVEPAARAGDLADELAAEVVEPLRERLERCFGETVDDGDELAERVRACYREWKGQRVDELVSRVAVGAANQGLLDRLPEGTLVHWVVEDGSTPSPDCDDNALAGDIPRGEPFPTGHTAPPISSHCRCLVAPKAG